MLEQDVPSIPPGRQSHSPKGHLTLTPVSLTFFSDPKQHHLLKVHFWGTSPLLLPLNSSLTLPVVSSPLHLKMYLLESKCTLISVLDSRNGKSIGYAFLNWGLYLRSLEDQGQRYQRIDRHGQERRGRQYEDGEQGLYWLPFIDERMEAVLPVWKHSGQQKKNNEKVGQLTIGWTCTVRPVSGNNRANMPLLKQDFRGSCLREQSSVREEIMQEEQQEDYRIRVSGAGKTCNNLPGRPLLNVSREAFQRGSTNSSNYGKAFSIANLDKIHHLQKQERKDSNIEESRGGSRLSLNEVYFTNGRKGKQEQEIPKEQRCKAAPIASKWADYRGSSLRQTTANRLELELIQLRIDMDSQHPSSSKQISSQMLLQIAALTVINRQTSLKQLLHLDIFNQQHKMRLFPSEQTQIKGTLTAQVGVCLSFAAAFRKSREVLRGKGQVRMRQCKMEVNLLAGDGVICAVLSIQIDHPSKISQIKPESLQPIPQKSGQNNTKAQKKKEPTPLDVPINRPSQSIQHSPERSLQPSLYYIIVFHELSPQSYIYSIHSKTAEGPQNPKYLLFSQEELIQKDLRLSIHSPKRQLLYEETLMTVRNSAELNRNNLTCQLLVERYLPSLQCHLEVCLGSVQQIVHKMQQTSDHEKRKIQKGSYEYSRSGAVGDRTKTEQVQERLIKQAGQRVPTQERQRTTTSGRQRMDTQERMRLNTDEGLRLDTQEGRLATQERPEEANSEMVQQLHPEPSNNIEHQQEQSSFEQLYLVDLLTRFLSSLASFPLPQNTLNKQQFILLLQQSSVDLPAQVLQLVVSVFQEEPEGPIQLELLRQSLKAFSTFNNIYGQQKDKIIKELLSLHSNTPQRIKEKAQLGMLNEEFLWEKALPSASAHLRKTVNKMYKISTFGPTDASCLLEDLEGNRKIRPIDICNLGAAVKEWVQEFLLNTEVPALNRDRLVELAEEGSILNIRSVEVAMQEMSLKLSLWESLMLIEEIKTAYMCDLEVGQGLISVENFVAWLETSLHKEHSQNGQSQHSSFYFDRLPNNIRENNPSGASKKSRRSVDRSRLGTFAHNNNDSEIMDIANLLRLKQEEEERRLSKLKIDSPLTFQQHQQPQQPEAVACKQPDEDRGDAQNYFQSMNKKMLNFTSVPLKGFSLSVTSLRLYDHVQNTLKLIVNLQGSSTALSFLYLTRERQYSQAEGHPFSIGAQEPNRGKSIQLILECEGERVGEGILDWQQYQQWLSDDQQTFRRTLVLHSSTRSIIGKMVLVLSKQLPSQPVKQQSTHNIQVSILESTVQEGSYVFTLTGQHQAPEPGQTQTGAQAVEVGTVHEMTTSSPIYSQQLLITHPVTNSECLISLEELYLRKHLRGQYPLLSKVSSNFVGVVTVSMAIDGFQLKDKDSSWRQVQERNEQLQEKRMDLIRREMEQSRRKGQSQPQQPSGVGQGRSREEVLVQVDQIYNQLRAKFT